MKLQDRSLGLHTFWQIRMNVLGEKLGRVGLRFPDLENSPPISGRTRSMCDEPLRMLKGWAQGGDHAVIPFQRLARNVSGNKYSHASIKCDTVEKRKAVELHRTSGTG